MSTKRTWNETRLVASDALKAFYGDDLIAVYDTPDTPLSLTVEVAAGVLTTMIAPASYPEVINMLAAVEVYAIVTDSEMIISKTTIPLPIGFRFTLTVGTTRPSGDN